MDENKKKSGPIVVNRDEVVQTTETPFLLHDGDFLRLTKVHSFLAIWAHSFFAGTGVFFVNIMSKWFDHRYFGSQTAISSQEWVTICILLALVFVFEGLYFWLPSEKKKTVTKIQKYFEKYK